MKKLIPVNKKIVIKPIEEKFGGGLIVPETLKQKKGFGTVISLASEVRFCANVPPTWPAPNMMIFILSFLPLGNVAAL